MVNRILMLLCAILLGLFVILVSMLTTSAPHAFAASKPQLTLNRQKGPSGVTLSLKGKNLPPGQASLSYIDAQGVPGSFAAPSDSSVQVQVDGTFATTNILLPASGPAGNWKILLTDSSGAVWSVKYQVLAAPGAQEAGAPTLTVNPTSGKGGDSIAFTGNNWLPGGTAVKLSLLADTNSLPLLDTPPVSNKSGVISGTFHLPTDLNLSLVAVNATDVGSGALRSQAQISLIDSSAVPTASPTQLATTTSGNAATATPGNNISLGSNNPRGPFPPLSPEVWGLLLLIVGGALIVAAVMLILFLIPWQEHKGNVPGSGHY